MENAWTFFVCHGCQCLWSLQKPCWHELLHLKGLLTSQQGLFRNTSHNVVRKMCSYGPGNEQIIARRFCFVEHASFYAVRGWKRNDTSVTGGLLIFQLLKLCLLSGNLTNIYIAHYWQLPPVSQLQLMPGCNSHVTRIGNRCARS